MEMDKVIMQYPEVQDIKWVRKNKDIVHDWIDGYIERCDVDAVCYLLSLLEQKPEVPSFGLSDKHSKVLAAIEQSLDADEDFEDVADFFATNGCYVYAKLINLVIPEAKLFLDKEAGHVKVYLDGIFFDALHAPTSEQSGSLIDDISDDIYCLKGLSTGKENLHTNIDFLRYCLYEYLDGVSESEWDSLEKRMNLFEKQFENIS